MFFGLGQRSGVDDIYDAGRIENINDLQPASATAAADRLVFFRANSTPITDGDDRFRLRRFNAMSINMLGIPSVPTEASH